MIHISARSQHDPGAHEAVEGSSGALEGNNIPRAQSAGEWPEQWMARVLDSASEALEVKSNTQAEPRLHEPCPRRVHWETIPVEVETTPEGLLRSHLGQATGRQVRFHLLRRCKWFLV